MQMIALINNKSEDLNTDFKKVEKNKTLNIDFLELLLKNVNIKEGENSKKIKNSIKNDEKNIFNDNKNIKELQEVLKEILLENKTPQNINLTNVINQLNIDKNIVQEVKNIITSNLKQKNILLTKIEIQNFKKIDNVKDLLKFANKKGLNIEKITFQVAKKIKQNPKLQNSIIEDIKNFKKVELSKFQPTTQILSTKKDIKLKNIISDKKISLEVVVKKTSLVDKQKLKNNLQKNIKNSEIKEGIIQKENNINKTIKIKQSKNEIHNENIKIEDIKKNYHNKNQVQETHKSQINLNYLLKMKHNNISDKEIVKNNNEIQNKKLLIPDIESNENKKDVNINLQNQNININEIKAKQVIAKETINHFKNNLDEAIKNYKPPISKVNIELNPKNLGKVEVTIIQRGNNIQVNMHTDQNNVVLFQNHQAEFRQALSNIGFSNIDMNFNSNQEKERKQQQAKKSYKDNKDNEIGEIEIKADYKYA